jgi:hypothetical protein
MKDVFDRQIAPSGATDYHTIRGTRMQPQKEPDPTPGGLAEQPPNPAHQNPGDERSHTTGTDNGTENTATDVDPAASNTPAGDPAVAAWLRSEGCPGDAVVLAGHPHAPPPPMSTPQGMGGLIVDMLDLDVDDNRVIAFAARWIPEPVAGDRTLGGEVYLTLSPTGGAEAPGTAGPDTTVDVRLQLIIRGHQRPIEQWTGLGHDWPQVIASHVAATMYTMHTLQS